MPIRTNRGRAAVYRKLWGWPMRSPRHLVILLLVVAAVVLMIGIIVPQVVGTGGGRPGAAAQTSDTTSDAAGSTGGGDTGTSDGGAPATDTTGSASGDLPTRLPSPPQKPTSAPPADGALKVADSWGKAWVHHPAGTTSAKWLDGLKPYTTEEYLVEMSTVDPANIPATKVTGPPVPKQSYTSSVTANLPTDGGTLAITVIDTPQGWRVAFYEQVA